MGAIRPALLPFFFFFFFFLLILYFWLWCTEQVDGTRISLRVNTSSVLFYLFFFWCEKHPGNMPCTVLCNISASMLSIRALIFTFRSSVNDVRTIFGKSLKKEITGCNDTWFTQPTICISRAEPQVWGILYLIQT